LRAYNLKEIVQDVSTAITLRREMLEAIQQKFPDFQTFDDLQWPLITPNGSPLPRPNTRVRARLAMIDSDDEEDNSDPGDISLKRYWETIRENYNTRVYNVDNLSTSQVDHLPKNWSVISINITEDRTTI
jgi:separase